MWHPYANRGWGNSGAGTPFPDFAIQLPGEIGEWRACPRIKTYLPPNFPLADFFFNAKAVERVRQIRGDLECVASFDLMALQHVNQLAVPEYSD
jgi:hypothetical protein